MDVILNAVADIEHVAAREAGLVHYVFAEALGVTFHAQIAHEEAQGEVFLEEEAEELGEANFLKNIVHFGVFPAQISS